MKFYDLHSDLPTASFCVSEKVKLAKNNEKLGYKAINAIYKGKNTFEQSVKIAKEFANGNLEIAFEDCCYNDYFCLEKVVSESKIINLINALAKFKPKYISLGWNYDNYFCGGCAGESALTKWGKLAVEKINDNNCVIDSSHCNKQTFYQLVEKSKKLICSHTAFEWIFPHRRNLDKNQIECILQKGGVVGLVGVGHFLTGIKGIKKNYESAFYEHIQGYLQNFGAKGLVLSTDFYGSDELLYPNGKYHFFYRLKNSLLKSGVSESDIEKIFYKNACDFFMQI